MAMVWGFSTMPSILTVHGRTLSAWAAREIDFDEPNS